MKWRFGRFAPRFSLRFLFVITTLAVLVVVPWRWIVATYHRQQRAAEMLRERGAKVRLGVIGPDRLRGALPNTERKYLERVTHISLDARQGDQVAPLPATDADLTQIRDCESVEDLSLGRNAISTSGFVAVRAFKRLRALHLNGSLYLDDTSMVHIGALSDLERLDLVYTLVTDAGVKHLAGLQHLRELNIDYSNISDESLKVIEQLRSLERVSFELTRVTKEGVLRLAERRPNLHISPDPHREDFWMYVLTEEQAAKPSRIRKPKKPDPPPETLPRTDFAEIFAHGNCQQVVGALSALRYDYRDERTNYVQNMLDACDREEFDREPLVRIGVPHLLSDWGLQPEPVVRRALSDPRPKVRVAAAFYYRCLREIPSDVFDALVAANGKETETDAKLNLGAVLSEQRARRPQKQPPE